MAIPRAVPSWRPSALQDGAPPRGREQKQEWPQHPGWHWSGRHSMLPPLPKEIPLFALNTSRPALVPWEPQVPTPAATQAGPPRATTVPSVLQRISKGRIPAPHRATRGPWPSRAWHAWAPASHASVRLVGARECLQSGRDAVAEAKAGGEFCPRGSVSGRARSLPRRSRRPARRGRGACAPGCAPFVVGPRRWRVRAVFAHPQGLSGLATPNPFPERVWCSLR